VAHDVGKMTVAVWWISLEVPDLVTTSRDSEAYLPELVEGLGRKRFRLGGFAACVPDSSIRLHWASILRPMIAEPLEKTTSSGSRRHSILTTESSNQRAILSSHDVSEQKDETTAFQLPRIRRSTSSANRSNVGVALWNLAVMRRLELSVASRRYSRINRDKEDGNERKENHGDSRTFEIESGNSSARETAN